MLHFHMYLLSVFEINAVKRLRFYCCFFTLCNVVVLDFFFCDAIALFLLLFKYLFSGLCVAVLLFCIQV